MQDQQHNTQQNEPTPVPDQNDTEQEETSTTESAGVADQKSDDHVSSEVSSEGRARRKRKSSDTASTEDDGETPETPAPDSEETKTDTNVKEEREGDEKDTKEPAREDEGKVKPDRGSEGEADDESDRGSDGGSDTESEREEAKELIREGEAETEEKGEKAEGEKAKGEGEEVKKEEEEGEEAENIESKRRRYSGFAVTEGGEDAEYTQDEIDEMINLYDETMQQLDRGEILPGTVVKITPTDVLVDVGLKSEGIIPIHEFTEPLNIKVGDTIEVYLEELEDQEGLLVLSKQRADFIKVWDKIKDAYNSGDIVEGKTVRRIKGGMVVNLYGVDAFLPGSQIDLKPIPNMDSIIGKTFRFRIIKINKRRRNIVVSRRVVLEEERKKSRERILKELEKGQVREGMVKNITDFGAFIDLGGVDGLLHITDMSWGRVSHPSELVSIGDTIEVKVLDFNENKERISLGLKQLTPYPWEDVDTKYPVDSKVKGRVVSITDYGAFVELEKGVEGLIHISEMSWTKNVKHPSKILSIDDEVEVVVLNVDKEGEKISLGLKQMQPDPWQTIDKRYPIGSIIEGLVRYITNFGAFVEIEDGIDGLVHISDMSWTRRIKHPTEILRRGETTEVMVLRIDKDSRRISLGIKQLQENPWETIEEKYYEGRECEGIITRIIDKGVNVELEESLEGFVPVSQLGRINAKKLNEVFNIGDSLPLKVLEVDPSNRRIILSVKEYFKSRDQAEYQEYLRKYSPQKTSIEDIVEGKMEKEKGEKEEKGEEEATPVEDTAVHVTDEEVVSEQAPPEEGTREKAEEERGAEEEEKGAEEEEKGAEEKKSPEPEPESITGVEETPVQDSADKPEVKTPEPEETGETPEVAEKKDELKEEKPAKKASKKRTGKKTAKEEADEEPQKSPPEAQDSDKNAEPSGTNADGV
jgi:small subunit ribosomal protein S1